MMRIFERHRARYEFVQMNGVDPWAKKGSAIRLFFGVTCQFCGFLVGLIGVLAFVLVAGAMMGAL